MTLDLDTLEALDAAVPARIAEWLDSYRDWVHDHALGDALLRAVDRAQTARDNAAREALPQLLRIARAAGAVRDFFANWPGRDGDDGQDVLLALEDALGGTAFHAAMDPCDCLTGCHPANACPGDAGHWDPETEPEVLALRDALEGRK